MILYCEHRGGGEETFGPIAELDLVEADIYLDPTERRSALRMQRAYIDTDEVGAQRRNDHDVSKLARLTFVCECGAALTAIEVVWAVFRRKLTEGGISRIEILDAKRSYQSVARQIDIRLFGQGMQ